MFKNCPKCDRQNIEAAKFCSFCGHPFQNAPPSGSPSQIPPSPSTDESPPATTDETGGGESSPLDSYPYIPQDRYDIHEEVGSGGMGKVLKALDKQTRRVVAMKRLILVDQDDREALDRFWREAHTIANLNHPYIVPLFDVGRDEEGPFLTMQFVDGQPLDEYVEENGKLPPQEAVDLAIKVSQALSYAHQHQVVHRDIKPANIMLDKTKLPRLLDFGLARLGYDSSLSISGIFMGTPYFASPEQIKDSKHVDNRTDIYSLGATLYYIVTGEIPKVVRPDRLDSPLLPVILKCMEDDPDKRFASAEELISTLQQLHLPATPLPPSTSGGVAMPLSTPMGKRICPSCQFHNEGAAKYCENCGDALFLKCPACAKEIGVQAKNCRYCGVNISQREQSLQYLHQATRYKENYNYVEAEEQARKGLDVEELPELKKLMTEVQAKEKEYREALEKGEAFYREGDLKESLENYRHAFKIKPPTAEQEQHFDQIEEKFYEFCLNRVKESVQSYDLTDAQEWCHQAAQVRKTKEVDEVMALIHNAMVESQKVEMEEKVEKFKDSLPSDVFRFLRRSERKCAGVVHEVEEYLHIPTKLEFVLIPGGTFLLGSDEWADTQPVHQVTVPPYLIARYPVTQELWKKFMDNNPSRFKGEKRPVENISWHDCNEFCKKTGLSLPSNAEWEFACRAGTTTRYYWGDDMDGEFGWYGGNSGGGTHPVGKKKPNAFGLHDIVGNVWEWCADVYHNDYEGSPTDGTPWKGDSDYRVVRGGSWYYLASCLCSAYRGWCKSGDTDGGQGFRCAYRGYEW